MDDARQSDLAYLHQVTEAARSAPLLGGRFLLFWGCLVSAAWLGQWAILSGVGGLPSWSLAILWLTFGIVAAVGMTLLTRSIRAKPGLGAVSNRVEAAIWSGAGFGLFSYIGGIIVAGSVGALADPKPIFDTILGVAFVLYALAFLGTAVASGQAWLRIFAALSFTGAGIVPFFIGDPVIYFISALIVFAVAAVPGFILLSREPASLAPEAA